MDEVTVGSSRTGSRQRLHRRRVLLLWQQGAAARPERGFPGWRFSDGAERLALGNGDNLELRAHTHASSLFAHAPTCSTCLADPHRAARPFKTIIRRPSYRTLNA